MKASNLFFVAFIVILFFISSCTKNPKEDLEFKKMCTDAGYEWMHMKPTQNGKIIKDAPECRGCMVELEHICSKEKFKQFVPSR